MSRFDVALAPTARRLAAGDATQWRAFADEIADECHPAQRDFVLDPSTWILAILGRGGGKTVGGCARFMRRLLLTPGANCFYLGRTRSDAKRLIWEPIKARFARLGFEEGRDVIYNETELRLVLTRTGATLRLYGADKQIHVQKLRGDTYHEVGIDEAAIQSDEVLRTLIGEVFGPRLVGALWLIGTAGKVLKGLWYELTRRGSTLSRAWTDRESCPDWRGWWLHRWTLASAIESTRERPIPALVELYRVQLERIAELGENHPIKRREYDAEWSTDDSVNVYAYRIHDPDTGAPWNQWDPPRSGPLGIAELPAGPTDWVHVIAMDPGYSDPTAINVFATSPSDPTRTIYHRLCYEAPGLYSQLVASVLLGPELKLDAPAGVIGALGAWPNALVADTAHQMSEAMLAELSNVYGLHFEGAQKGLSYKIGAIELVNGELIAGRIKILRDSALESQLLHLQWDESRTGAQIERKGDPNHSTDCLVYARPVLARFMTATIEGPPLPPRDPRAEPPLPRAPLGPDEYAIEDYSALLD